MLQLHKKDIPTTNWTFTEPVIAKVTENFDLPDVLRKHYFFVSKTNVPLPVGFAGYLKIGQMPISDVAQKLDNVILLDDEFNYMQEGDVVRFNPWDSSIRVVYRRSSPNNYFLITERCNSFCLMCSQPPRDINDDYHVDEIAETIPLIDKDTQEIGLTGGEPTLIGDRLIELIKRFGNHLPYTALHILTNGRRFSDETYAAKLKNVRHHDCMFGIPLYSHVPERHNFIVQAKNAFEQTVKGILNLKKVHQKVEIRVVVLKPNYLDLASLAEFISRNLTFVDQVVFMGLEPTGFAKSNMRALWVDPFDYQKELKTALQILDRAKIPNKIYNIQLCLLDSAIAHKSVRSISDWKCEFAPVCETCKRQSECCGIFGTGTAKHSQHLKAFV